MGCKVEIAVELEFKALYSNTMINFDYLKNFNY